MKYKKVILLLSSLILFTFFSFLYFQRASFYSFVDEFDNIVAAHFMHQGKVLFQDIYHNRQLGMVYISYIIQFLQLETLYQLILYHRLFIILTSVAFGNLLIIRFGYPALYTVALYELIKFYSFGNLFQGEGMIVYPTLYLTGLVIEGFQNKKITLFDTVITAFFVYLIIFTRETYIPLSLLLIALIAFKIAKKNRVILFLLLTVLSGITIATVPLKDYVYNLTFANINPIFSEEINIVKSFLYPVYFFMEGEWTYTRAVMAFVCLAYFWTFKYRKNFWLLGILGLSVLRIVPPGTEFFGAYKMLIWYALLIFITTSLINEKSKKIAIPLLSLALAIAVFAPQSIIWQKVDKEKEFNISYNRYFVYGEEIKRLSKPGDTLHVDGYDSLLYWQAGLAPAYKYILYYPISKNDKKYSEERIKMFLKNPPTFYYSDCFDKNRLRLPTFLKSKYINIKLSNKQSCLYKKK